MQREIKFRVWDKNTKKFLFQEDFAIRGDGLYILTWDWHHDYGKSWGFPRDDEYVIQQYTGLEDKNGKEIYEGDFIKYEHPNDDQCVSRNTTNIVLVRWSEENEDNHPGFRIVDLWGQYGEREVVGNIFENPELLKNEHQKVD